MTSVDLAPGINASNDTVRRMHDDNVALSNKCVLPVNIEMLVFGMMKFRFKKKNRSCIIIGANTEVIS